MKKYLLNLLALSIAVANGFPQQTRILFLGNSYTYVNDLPGTLSQLALSMGDSIYYDSNTPGGTNFNYHAGNALSLSKIAQPGWDYVVLQDQSQQPSFPPAQVEMNTYPYAARLDSFIHASNPCAITMFYMTWGRKFGDASNCAFYPPLCTFEGMNDRLRFSYLEMTTDNFARVAPVGVAWRHAREADSTINLWSADNSHPSVAGTYLTACVFYASIFKQSPVGSSYTAGLSAPDALFLQNIASQTVLDSMDTWMLDQNPINASFVDTINLSSIEVYSTSYNASQFWWNFGDGIGFSSLENSNYFYTAPGNYTVQLIAANACYADTAAANVTITSVGLNHLESNKLKVFPNPSKSYIYFTEDLNQKHFELLDVKGRSVFNGNIISNQINITGLDKGIYFLKVDYLITKIIVE